MKTNGMTILAAAMALAAQGAGQKTAKAGDEFLVDFVRVYDIAE